MKRMVTVIALALVTAAAACAAGAVKADRDVIQGTWFVSQGVYTDGTIEKELEMEFTFMKSTMTNPMSDGEIPYTLDEKAKIITAKDAKSTVWFRYQLVDASAMKLVEMRVTTAKGTTQIVGDKGTFKELDLSRKG
jgi:hypothetical protein